MEKMRTFLCIFVVLTAAAGDAPSNDYVVNEANGIAYRLVYQAKTWEKAKEFCEEDGGKLAVPKSEEEFAFIQKIVRGMQYRQIEGAEYKYLAWLGVNNLQNYKVWMNVDGENIENTGFSRWSGNNGNAFSDAPAEPHCVGVDSVNPGYRDWWCHKAQPFVCQKQNTTTATTAAPTTA